MKKIIASLTLTGILFTASPAFAHVVQVGDTMGEIATKEGMTLEELALVNPQVRNLNLIFPGETINTNENESVQVSVPAETQVQVAQTSVTNYEKDLLARLVRAEAQSEPYIGKVAVAVVVLNRVASDKFPNSIKEVIYQQGQFSPITNGSINKSADAESIRAVEEALTVNRSSNQSLFFYNPKIAKGSWLDSRATTEVIGNHVFKK